MAGAFVWHELMTTDTPAATAFYTNVVGWTPQDCKAAFKSFQISGVNSVQ